MTQYPFGPPERRNHPYRMNRLRIAKRVADVTMVLAVLLGAAFVYYDWPDWVALFGVALLSVSLAAKLYELSLR